MQLENLHHFSNLCDNFQFNTIWHRWSMAALIFCRRLVESDVTVTPTVICMDWLGWWYNHAVHLVSFSTALAFLTNMIEKQKSTSPSTMEMKSQQKTIGTEEKSNAISHLEKREWIVNICHNVRLAHRHTCTTCDNADTIKESAKLGTTVFVCIARLHSPFRMNHTQNHRYELLTFLWN